MLPFAVPLKKSFKKYPCADPWEVNSKKKPFRLLCQNGSKRLAE
jgi:hypothetical protein